jgi:hypothetical protein
MTDSSRMLRSAGSGPYCTIIPGPKGVCVPDTLNNRYLTGGFRLRVLGGHDLACVPRRRLRPVGRRTGRSAGPARGERSRRDGAQRRTDGRSGRHFPNHPPCF